MRRPPWDPCAWPHRERAAAARFGAPAPLKLTAPQAQVLEYLYRSGWASEKQTARMLFGNRRQRARAAVIIRRLEADGLAETYLRHDGGGRAWRLTDAGRDLARDHLESGKTS